MPAETPTPREEMVLASCPFCGGEAFSHAIEPHSHGPVASFMPDHPGSGYVECMGCSAGIAEATEAEAIAAWNRRTPTPSAAVEQAGASSGEAAREAGIPQSVVRDLMKRAGYDDSRPHPDCYTHFSWITFSKLLFAV
ncbi:Lar family restriction alleviation protein, partial [Roseomonas chloroacetimidivorans]|uniref:Lar family restriction alleviation protein n=1 Tax=Roseomonas chloroacetimidivorans TaxID=1766656 RepID=UPI003C725AA8